MPILLSTLADANGVTVTPEPVVPIATPTIVASDVATIATPSNFLFLIAASIPSRRSWTSGNDRWRLVGERALVTGFHPSDVRHSVEHMSTTLGRARRLVEEAGETGSPEAYATVVVDGIWDLFPNDETTFMETDRATGRVLVERWRTVIPPSPSDDRFTHEDMPFCPLIADGESVVVRMSDVIGRRELERLPVYRELMEPLGERYVVWAQFEQRPDTYRCIGFSRADRDITDAELDLMILMTPHLDLAYRRARARSKVTVRELEVVGLVGQGLTNQEIARRLQVSPGTIRSHLEHVFAKLGVGTRTAAVAALR